MNKEELEALNDEIMPNGVRRRDFLKGVAAVGMGAFPLAMLLAGCNSNQGASRRCPMPSAPTAPSFPLCL